jgi:hypothetical protein
MAQAGLLVYFNCLVTCRDWPHSMLPVRPYDLCIRKGLQVVANSAMSDAAMELHATR